MKEWLIYVKSMQTGVGAVMFFSDPPGTAAGQVPRLSRVVTSDDGVVAVTLDPTERRSDVRTASRFIVKRKRSYRQHK